MTLYRRATALLTAVLTLQLTLAGDLVLCANVAGATSGIVATASDAGMARMDMGGMDMAGMDMAGMTMPADANEAPDTPAPSEPDTPCGQSLPSRGCDLPIDGQDCAAMLACAPAIGVIAEVATTETARHGHVPITGAIMPGLSRSTAPESPPPRA